MLIIDYDTHRIALAKRLLTDVGLLGIKYSCTENI